METSTSRRRVLLRGAEKRRSHRCRKVVRRSCHMSAGQRRQRAPRIRVELRSRTQRLPQACRTEQELPARSVFSRPQLQNLVGEVTNRKKQPPATARSTVSGYERLCNQMLRRWSIRPTSQIGASSRRSPYLTVERAQDPGVQPAVLRREVDAAGGGPEVPRGRRNVSRPTAPGRAA